MNLNYSYISSEYISEAQNKIYENITEKNLSNFKDHILHEDNFNYNDENDIKKYKDTHFDLSEIFKNFSISTSYYTRYQPPQMPSNFNIEQLKSRRKLEVLDYPKNRLIKSNGERLSRIYKNTNMKHPSYTSQSHKGGITNNNIRNLERVDNRLIYKGQKLNRERTQTLHSNNGGNLRSKTGNNYRITTDPNYPLIGLKRKIIHHEISKHERVKIKLPILH